MTGNLALSQVLVAALRLNINCTANALDRGKAQTSGTNAVTGDRKSLNQWLQTRSQVTGEGTDQDVETRSQLTGGQTQWLQTRSLVTGRA